MSYQHVPPNGPDRTIEMFQSSSELGPSQTGNVVSIRLSPFKPGPYKRESDATVLGGFALVSNGDNSLKLAALSTYPPRDASRYMQSWLVNTARAVLPIRDYPTSVLEAVLTEAPQGVGLAGVELTEHTLNSFTGEKGYFLGLAVSSALGEAALATKQNLGLPPAPVIVRQEQGVATRSWFGKKQIPETKAGHSDVGYEALVVGAALLARETRNLIG